MQVRPGIYFLNRSIRIPAGHSLIGISGKRDQTVLKAVPPWSGVSVLVIKGSVNFKTTASELTIDANNLSTLGVWGDYYFVTNLRVRNAICDGISIRTSNVEVLNSVVESNGL